MPAAWVSRAVSPPKMVIAVHQMFVFVNCRGCDTTRSRATTLKKLALLLRSHWQRLSYPDAPRRHACFKIWCLCNRDLTYPLAKDSNFDLCEPGLLVQNLSFALSVCSDGHRRNHSPHDRVLPLLPQVGRHKGTTEAGRLQTGKFRRWIGQTGRSNLRGHRILGT
jgi:hypothetical protein